MGAVFSKRFLIAKAGLVQYTVPDGSRAIVKCVTASNTSAGARAFGVYIGDDLVSYRIIQPSSSLELVGLTIVVNSGEKLGLFSEAPATAQCSGYLLDAS